MHRGIRPLFRHECRKMSALKLYMTPGSCSTGIHIILEELEEIFEAYVVNLPAGDHFKPDYVAINPKSTIPALVRSDGSVLTEVPAIAFWLGKSRLRAGLWPSKLEGETRAVEVMAYVAGTIHGQGFARIFATATFARNPADHPEVQALGRRIVEQGFSILDATMQEEGFVVGGFSVADPVLFYVEFWADKTNISLPPRLAAHYRRMLARPAVQRVLREEGYDPGKLGQRPQ
jgi:glutathione S-transferase